MFQTKRIYDDPGPSDGLRVLVDRLWPRGVSKDHAQLDRWLQAIAPSDELRAWFDHDPDRWEGFCRRYAQELEDEPEKVEAVAWLTEQAKAVDQVTLLYAAKDTEHNNAVALKRYLEMR